MFARVDIHWVNEGMMDKAQAQIAENTVSAKKTGDVIARYSLASQTDPMKIITTFIWKSKEAWGKWREAARAERAQNPSSAAPFQPPSPWSKIEGDNYEASQEI